MNVEQHQTNMMTGLEKQQQYREVIFWTMVVNSNCNFEDADQINE